jgi:hypothetical protein
MTTDHAEALTHAYELRSLLEQMSTAETSRLADRARLALDQLDDVIKALEPPLDAMELAEGELSSGVRAA